MVIYLKHPVHGAKVAISEVEAEEDMKNGWVVFDPTKPEKPESDAAHPASAPVDESPRPRRRGRRATGV